MIKFKNPPSICGYASVGGKEEYDGPLGAGLDFHDDENRFSEKTWEKSEASMQRIALNLAISDCKGEKPELKYIFAGDLINQCTSSSYGLVDFEVPYIGLFGACSTCAEGLALASLFVDSGYADCVAAVTSSHFCSAERQFRFPLEYGGQRPPTAQRTVTAAGAFLLSDRPGKVRVYDVCFGITSDGGITDANNMGAAMAPAAVDTLMRYFDGTDTSPDDYDRIFTGDLGFEGWSLVKELSKEQGRAFGENYDDCGLLVYNRELRDMHAGGSGCGCSAMTLAAYILPKMEKGELKNVLFVGTGALMSPTSVQQGESIPGVAHLVHLVADDREV